MDYVTRQFINLAKKLRDDVRKLSAALHNDLSHISDGLKHLKETISTQWQADNKSRDTPPITVTELRTQVPIRVQTEAQRSKIETIWRVTKGALEAAGIVAAIIYAMVAYQQWQETITATNFSARQTELSRKGLNETIKNFRSGERAWIGITNVTVNGEETTYPTVISYYVSIMNAGHSPGLNTVTYGYQIVEPGRSFKLPTHNVTADPLHTSATVFPNVPHIGAGRHRLTPDEITAVKERTSFFYAYGTVFYQDIFRQPHWSHYCYRFDTQGGNQPFHICDAYNDTDDYPKNHK